MDTGKYYAALEHRHPFTGKLPCLGLGVAGLKYMRHRGPDREGMSLVTPKLSLQTIGPVPSKHVDLVILRCQLLVCCASVFSNLVNL